MTNLKLRYIHRSCDRHGHVRHYFRRDGQARVTLPGLPGSREFMAAYQAALTGKEAPPGAGRIVAGTMDALIVAWYQSTGYRQLSPSTKSTYRNVVEAFRKANGEKRVATIEPTHIRKLLAAKVETPAAANSLLRLLRLLMRFAVEEGWRKDNPTLAVRRLRERSGGFHTWTEEEIATFEARWALGTRERLALALLLYTGQRRSDVVRMGRQHVRAGKIEVVQAKTGARLALPMHAALRDALTAYPSDHLTFLVTRAGAPFTPPGFTNWFHDACVRAGLPKGCSPHGLRKAAARRLAEAGCSANEIASVTGHRTLSEVARYTRDAEQSGLAERAIGAIGNRKPNVS